MKNEAEIIWWKTVKQDVETTPLGFTEAAARVEGTNAVDRAESIFKRGCSLSISDFARRPRYEPISIEPMRRRELAVGVLIRWVVSLPKVDDDDEAMFCGVFGSPPKLPADRFARITFFVKYEITYRNFCGGRGGLRHE
ncbi:hypothetical protein ALC57_14000 [Trachymyrmex cornetzi]|uniref:Uncharacterized protein n=1 Tax=Trachymyrmex cornetzi TaxID=471704 RepID=A0A195DM61_9HYME|nr:hypothetical protein ALC57_14000 [Trachymyrmex cornetzi]